MTVFVLLVIFAGYFYFEKSSLGTKEIAIIATLSAFAAICRLPFAAIPNVQPTTFIVAISGYAFGPYAGFLVGSTTAFVSNIFLGQGPWTPWQMFAWGLVGALSGLIGRRKQGGMSVLAFSMVCFLYGFMFDWIMNLWHVLGFIKPLTLKAIMLAYLTGLTVDIMHACGNFVFSMIFFEKFYKVLLRSKRRLQITYIGNDNKQYEGEK
ncbi:MAG: rane protein [Firmicutes bacterium]|nr:rane protein [Bacillota bacterium]